jgi:hypothetical protein
MVTFGTMIRKMLIALSHHLAPGKGAGFGSSESAVQNSNRKPN